MPPLNKKTYKTTTLISTITPASGPAPMQISVTPPPPQILWWLGPNTMSHLPPPLPVSGLSQHFGPSINILPFPLHANGLNSIQLLHTFIEWFKGSVLSSECDEEIKAVSKAYIKLKKEMYDLKEV